MSLNVPVNQNDSELFDSPKQTRRGRRKKIKVKRLRRPWGTDREYGGMPVMAKPVGRATLTSARFAIFFTIVAWIAYCVEQVLRLANTSLDAQSVIETSLYLLIVTALTASAMAYLMARLGYYERTNAHHRVPRSTIDDQFEEGAPSLTVLVPSYREEERVVRLTLLSAALQEYPNMRVRLLIDDPPNPTNVEHKELLQKSRLVVQELMDLLEGPKREFEFALLNFTLTQNQNRVVDRKTLEILAANYHQAAFWFANQRAEMDRSDHIDEFFIIEFLERMAQDLRTTAEAVQAVSLDGASAISWKRVNQLYQRLVNIFSAEIKSFERKQFASLSHEPNKAMNLNSYIGLMGQSFNVANAVTGRVLIPTDAATADITIPDSDYLLTLDADSLLLPEYCLRLVHFLEQPENSDYAIAQTPYSSYRGTHSRIERIAGATTDIQHIVHIGLTKYNATFWVGANAVIRKRALLDIEETYDEGSFTMRRYISDRTVIEDTESSIDLREKGWRLYNYPERLSYSATPPDFGSLIIQRRRWANGGLVILPKLLRFVGWRKAERTSISLSELFLRMSYLASISWSTVGLIILLFYPFDDQLLSRLAVLTAAPYWLMMMGDLKRSGYKRRDLFQIYGFNLLLLPVNLVGTIQSVVQAIGGQRTAFARTPKVKDRTVSPTMYLAIPLILLVWSGWTLVKDLTLQQYIHGAFASANMMTIFFALLAHIGFGTIVVDIFVNMKEFAYKPASAVSAEKQAPDWASVLYVGSSLPEQIGQGNTVAAVLAAQDHVVQNSAETLTIESKNEYFNSAETVVRLPQLAYGSQFSSQQASPVGGD